MTYHYAEKSAPPGAPLLMTFHGTGGDETQFHDLAATIRPDARVISARGDVSERGANRFFKRTGEGVYDMADLALRADAMAGFVAEQKAAQGASTVMGFGYSNGANILAAIMLKYPQLFDRAAWLHPLIPWAPAPQPGLKGARVLISAGRRDPICPAPLTQALVDYVKDQQSDVTLLWHEGGHEIHRSEVDALATFLAAD
ncbi:alpha/beta hydrolase [Roseobacter weihaiensis]|uniref:alpha/beta hydrolase n=1 Tax=Roseobacter weihaiensis TaxID=2763262 RepID=UPI001D0BAA8D|nr:alpha/beta hydrolase [Roseobacter sp. H9]